MSAEFPGKGRSEDQSDITPGKRNIQLVEEYGISGNAARVQIILDEKELEYIYIIKEPLLGSRDHERADRLVEEIERMIPLLTEGTSFTTYSDLESVIGQYIATRYPGNDEDFNSRMKYSIQKRHTGFGDLHAMVMDAEVEDISCNGPSMPVYVYHRKYGSIKTNVSYGSEAELSSTLVKLAQLCGKEVSVSNPILDGITKAGHRVQGIYGKEISPRGSAFTIRLFREKPFTPVELVRSGAASSEMIAYFWYMVEYLNSGLIVGPPAVGKTSTLNSLLMLVPPNTKVLSIEETREINILHPNWVAASTRDTSNTSSKISSAETRIDMFELVKMAMRQRPTYLVVGEVRGKEAYTLFQAMSTGHTTYSTMHAESMSTMLNRLESEPLSIPRILVSYLRTVIISKFIRREQQTLRRITEVNEIMGVDNRTNEVIYNRVFSYDSYNDRHTFSGFSGLLRNVAQSRGITEEKLMGEFYERKRIIDYMADSEELDYREVSRIVNMYYNNRQELERLLAEGIDGKEQ